MSSGTIDLPAGFHSSTGPNDRAGPIGRHYHKEFSGGNSSWKPGKGTKRGSLALTDNVYNCSFSEYYGSLGGIRNKATHEEYTGSIVGLLGYAPLPSGDPWTNNDDIKILNKLNEQVRKHSFNAGIFFGEGHETIKMITGTAIRLAESMRALKKGNVAAAARHLGLKPGKTRFRKSVSQEWLALQYGWIPLLKDVQDAAEAAANLMNKPSKRKYTARGEAHQVTEVVGPGLYKFAQMNQVRISVSLTLTEEYSPIASLGLLDPEVVAWELVPFSFVADWFIPIGSFLEARAHTGRLKGTWVSSRKDYRRSTLIGGSSEAYESMFNVDLQSIDGTFARGVTSTPPPVPLPNFKDISKALSIKHCMNALALLNQAFR